MRFVGWGCATLVVIAVVVALSFGALVWSGALRVGDTAIQREVNVQSQQYITAHNDQILGLIADYTNTTDSARQTAIVNQVCSLAGEINGHVISTATTFVAVHCN